MAFETTQQEKEAAAAPFKTRWYHLCRKKKDISVEDGTSAKKTWDCHRSQKIRSQDAVNEPDVSTKNEQLEAPLGDFREPRPMPELPYTRWICIDSTGSATIICSRTTVSSSDTLESSSHTLPSTQSEENMLLDVQTVITIMEHIKSGEKSFKDKSEDIRFLSTISASCMAAEKSGQGTLDLPYSKADLAEAIVMVMETLPVHSVPTSILSCSMLAIYNLSKIKPTLDPEVESCVLRLALHGVINMEIEKADAHSQALYKSSVDTMEIMLRGLLSTIPTTKHLLFILKHINFWIQSKDTQERARAMKCSTSLLRYAVLLPDFYNSDEIPILGRQVALLGICITDSVEDVSRQAREGVYRLYELLLHQIGLNMNEATELWSREWQKDKKMLAYVNTCRVGKVFGKAFSEAQRRSFLDTALLAIYNPLLRISEAGILLVYSLLGKDDELMGEEVEEVKTKILRQLHKLRTCREIPEALQSFFFSAGVLEKAAPPPLP